MRCFLSSNAINGVLKLCSTGTQNESSHKWWKDEVLYESNTMVCAWTEGKNITFLKSNLFQWKKLSIEFFFIIFLALETCLVAVSIGNCTFCFWGEITCGSVDWHKLAYRRNISLTKKWKWEFIFFADGRPQVEEIWILDSFCTKHIFERLQHVFVVCDSVLYEFLFASWHGLQKWRKFISQTT